MLNEWLKGQAERLGLALTEQHLQQLRVYSQLLREWNQRINLTSITELEAIYELHFLDSLSVQLAVDLKRMNSLVDVGTGAGFPGLVMAIVFDQLEVTLLDSTRKKVDFLRLVASELGLLDRVHTVCMRAEEAGRQKGLRDSFEVVVSRGVARLSVLAEYCLPLASTGGLFVAMKGPDVAAEMQEAKKAFTTLGGGEGKCLPWVLPSGAGRSLVCVPKLSSTPSGYPRRVGLPAKRPVS
ncbi:MAG: 16S rRNA (guanine(527)-N(7))-methyltransferase RsmG [Bacillota bacterium]|jgi:16S rRNA (guanine527-N7)-methyltransferase